MIRRHRPVRPRSLFTRREGNEKEAGGATGEDATRLAFSGPFEGGSVTLDEVRICLVGKSELGGASDLGAGICDEGERPEDLARGE